MCSCFVRLYVDDMDQYLVFLRCNPGRRLCMCVWTSCLLSQTTAVRLRVCVSLCKCMYTLCLCVVFFVLQQSQRKRLSSRSGCSGQLRAAHCQCETDFCFFSASVVRVIDSRWFDDAFALFSHRVPQNVHSFISKIHGKLVDLSVSGVACLRACVRVRVRVCWDVCACVFCEGVLCLLCALFQVLISSFVSDAGLWNLSLYLSHMCSLPLSSISAQVNETERWVHLASQCTLWVLPYLYVDQCRLCVYVCVCEAGFSCVFTLPICPANFPLPPLVRPSSSSFPPSHSPIPPPCCLMLTANCSRCCRCALFVDPELHARLEGAPTPIFLWLDLRNFVSWGRMAMCMRACVHVCVRAWRACVACVRA
jgi:hypothetical protein